MIWVLLLFPLIWPCIAKYLWDRDISWKEMGLNCGIVVVVVTGVWFAGRYFTLADTEIWNGQVQGKDKVLVSCEHSYSCRCRTTCSGGKDGACSETCDTCYDHFNDWDWRVRTTIGPFTVNRVDRQGSWEPPRWTKVQIGQPVARERSFINYIQAAKYSLFNPAGSLKEQYAKLLPDYPSVYDYHYVDRVIPMGVEIPDLASWNTELALMLRELGPKKQVNVIVVVVNTPSEEYAYALQEHWVGGKKNDVVVILGVTQYPKIAWAHVMSWTDSHLFKVQLRDALLSHGSVDKDKVLGIIGEQVSSGFVRKPMADFEYLKYEVDPPTWVIVLAFLLAFLGPIGLSQYFRTTEI